MNISVKLRHDELTAFASFVASKVRDGSLDYAEGAIFSDWVRRNARSLIRVERIEE